MATEFDKIFDRAVALTGARHRKYYSDFDEPPSDGEVAKAIKGIQGETSDQLAMMFEMTKLMISIKQSLAVVAIATSLIAAVAVRVAFVNNFWN